MRFITLVKESPEAFTSLSGSFSTFKECKKKKKSYGVFVHMFDKGRYINSACKVAQLCLGL